MIGLASFLVGLVFLLITFACVLGAAAIITSRRFAGLRGSVRLAAYSVLATAILLAVHMVPGALGVLSRWTVLAASMLALLVAWRVPSAASEPGPAPSSRRVDEPRGSWLVAIVGCALAAGYALAYLRYHYADAPTGVDALSFHLPDVARWIQTGTFWQINQFLPQLAQGNYPNTGDVVFLAFVLPFKSAVLVRWAMVPYLAATAVTVFALGRELGAPRPASALFAAALTTVPAVLAPALVKTQTDTVMLFGFAAGVLFLLRHRRSQAAADLLIAGIALGIAFGTKWYGVSCVAVVVVVWAAASYLGGDRWQLVGRRALALVGIVLLAGGFWLLRNLIESGDPFFPARVRLLHVTIFDAPPDVVRQVGGFTIAHYFGDVHVLRVYVLPALLRTLGWLGALLAVSTVGAAAVALMSRRRTSAPAAGMVLAVAVAAVLVAIAYTVTPYTAFGPRNMPVQTGDNTRYLVPALVLSAPLAAWVTGRLGRAGLVLELAGVGLIVDALSRLLPLGGRLALVLTAAIGAAGIVALRPRYRRNLSRLRPRRGMPLAIGLLIALTAVVGALATRRAYNEQPYQADATLAWLLQHAPAGHRIGLAGVWSNGIPPIFPAFGPRLGNRVAYVGPVVRHMLQQYGGAAPFGSAVRSGGYDLLIVGRGYPQPQADVPSQAWAQAAGFREVASSGRLVLYARAGA